MKKALVLWNWSGRYNAMKLHKILNYGKEKYLLKRGLQYLFKKGKLNLILEWIKYKTVNLENVDIGLTLEIININELKK